MILTLLAALAATLPLQVAAALQMIRNENVLAYITQPEFNPPRFDLFTHDRDRISPGYFFICPWATSTIDTAPYIYDSDGELVWSGAPVIGGGETMNFHACDYNGAPHLCFFDGLGKKSGWAQGHGKILNNEYKDVATIQSSYGQGVTDMHEFSLTKGGKSAVVTIFSPRPYDFSFWNITNQFGWILEGRFQEVDVDTGEVLFDWSALDHVSPLTSPVMFQQGYDRNSPWDYFHLNSIEKLDDGDYLISSRHFSTLYKISGTDGEIIWQMGGPQSDYNLTNFIFAFQHHPRVQNYTDEKMVISFFNNGWDGRNTRLIDHSSALFIEVDHVRKTATMIQEYDSAYRDLSASSQGSVGVVPGHTNVVVGWGRYSWVTEHTSTGEIVLNASIANHMASNYRVFKMPWEGHPRDTPAFFTYAKSKESPMVYYVSWNGATEVGSWRFYSSWNEAGPYEFIGEREKTGFETNFTMSHNYPWSIVEAISKTGEQLANSSAKETFIPGEHLREKCGEDMCPMYIKPNITRLRPPNLGRPPSVVSPENADAENMASSSFWHGAILGAFCSSLVIGLVKMQLAFFGCKIPTPWDMWTKKRRGANNRKKFGAHGGYEKIPLQDDLHFNDETNEGSSDL